MILLDQCTSTNDFLLHNPDIQAEEKILLVQTYEQTAGRGQAGNRWISDRAANLLFSVRVRPQHLMAADAFVLSQAMALAIKRSLQHFLPESQPVIIKWPNDIYVQGSKICGILIENTLLGKTVSQSIIGCGININQGSFPEGLAAPATSLRLLTGRGHEISPVLKDIYTRFYVYYDMIESGELDPIREEYHESLLWLGEEHTYKDCEGTFQGTICRVENDGHLILRDSQEKLRKYAFKEIKKIL